MLVPEHWAECIAFYARVAYSSAMAKTTSSSSFLQRESKKGSSEVLMA